VTTLFVVEKSKKATDGAAIALMGDYAIRVFGSLTSLQCLARVTGQTVPDVVVVDIDDVAQPVSSIVSLVGEILPQSALILLYTGEISEEDYCQGTKARILACFFQKPWDSMALSQLVARIAKSAGRKTNTLRLGDFVFDFDRLHCRHIHDDLTVNLPLKEAQILKVMMERSGEYLSRADIHQILWPNIKVSSRTIDSHISRLRKRLRPMQITISNKYGDGDILQRL
jgi:DNA-binding response OmpR family regulator